MRINFNNADLTIAVTRNSDNLHLVFHHVESIEDRTAKDMIKDGYDVVKGTYVTIRLNAKGDYEIATFKKTKDLVIDIIGSNQAVALATVNKEKRLKECLKYIMIEN